MRNKNTRIILGSLIFIIAFNILYFVVGESGRSFFAWGIYALVYVVCAVLIFTAMVSGRRN